MNDSINSLNNIPTNPNGGKTKFLRSTKIIIFLLLVIIILFGYIIYLVFIKVKDNLNVKTCPVCEECEVCEKYIENDELTSISVKQFNELYNKIPRLSNNDINYDLFNSEGVDYEYIKGINTIVNPVFYRKVYLVFDKVEIKNNEYNFYYYVLLYDDNTEKYSGNVDNENFHIAPEKLTFFDNKLSDESIKMYGNYYMINYKTDYYGYYVDNVSLIRASKAK